MSALLPYFTIKIDIFRAQKKIWERPLLRAKRSLIKGQSCCIVYQVWFIYKCLFLSHERTCRTADISKKKVLSHKRQTPHIKRRKRLYNEANIDVPIVFSITFINLGMDLSKGTSLFQSNWSHHILDTIILKGFATHIFKN